MNDAHIDEQPVGFACEGETLVGVLTRPLRAEPKRIGVVIIVGGPQYRAGSHRQFVHLARSLANAGWPVLRFDCRGMGDSTGERRTFESIEADIRSAVDTLHRLAPQVEGAVLWGLCDAASAALMYASSDKRVLGLALANPWARAQQSYAKTQLRHYYAQRLLEIEFWRKLLSGRFGLIRSLRGLALSFQNAVRPSAETSGYRQRMLAGLSQFHGQVLWILSGRDLTAREFVQFMQGSRQAIRLCANEKTSRVDLPLADHTFAHPEWRANVEDETANWLAAHWR